MNDDRVRLHWQQQIRFGEAVARAVQETVEAQFAKMIKHDADEAVRNEKNRKDFARHQAGEWNETFELSITRFGTIYGCNAHVVRRGAPHNYTVYQNAHRFRTGEPPQWFVRKNWRDSTGSRDTVLWDWASEDFEAAIRRCAMELMGWS